MKRRKPQAQVSRPAPQPAASAGPDRKPLLARRDYRLAPALIGLGLIFAVLFAYADLLSKGGEFFELDDGDYVVDNPHVQAGLTGDSIEWAFTTYHARNWHPLTWLSLQLDHELFGLEPWGYRLTNVLLHAANAVLLFVLLEWLTKAMWPSALVAGLFALHPLHVESVAWITERKDVLSTLFALLTLAAYGWYVAAPTLRRYLVVAACFALGLMAKQMLVTLPFVMLLLDYWPLRRFEATSTGTAPAGRLRLLLEKLPLLALSLLASIVTVAAQGVQEESLLTPPAFHARVLNACLAYVAYLRKTFWPNDLAPMYSQPLEQLSLVGGIAAGVVLAIVTVLVLIRARKQPYLAVGWLWFVGTLVPVIGLVQVGYQTMADRYTYLPHIGLFIMLVWGLAALFADRVPPALLAVGAGVILLTCFVSTRNQAKLWRENLAIWEHTVRVTENNFVAHRSLGSVLVERGQIDEGIEHYRKALRIEPSFALGHYYLGLARTGQEKWSDAAGSFAEVVRLTPQMTPAYHELGFCLVRLGHMEEAVEPLTVAALRDANQGPAHYNLATALLQRGRYGEAMEAANTALKLDPRLRDARTLLGIALAAQGKPAEAEPHFRAAAGAKDPEPAFYVAWCAQATGQAANAREQYRAALQKFPAWPKETRTETWRQATHPEAKRRNGSLALLRAQAASQALEDRDTEALDTLAAAWAEVGNFSEATTAARKALELAQGLGVRPLADRIAERLRLYEQGRAYRGTP